MVSETALESIDELEGEGLKPTPRDVIRLNALGLRLESVRGKRVLDSTFHLHRVAAVSDDLAFRQPTIGHEIWLAKVERWVKPGDAQTMLALHCFALSRAWDKLPDPETPSVIRDCIEPWLDTVKDFTRDQLYAAVSYALYGCDQKTGESSAKRKTESGDEFDLEECVAVGILNKGRAILFGISEADMRGMTAKELSDVIHDAYSYHGLSTDGEASRLEADYFATVDEIRKRLKGG